MLGNKRTHTNSTSKKPDVDAAIGGSNNYEVAEDDQGNYLSVYMQLADCTQDEKTGKEKNNNKYYLQ